jgi:hypothetical protein
MVDDRVEGLPPPRGWEVEIWEAYIRGEIDPGELIDVLKKVQQRSVESRTGAVA